MSHDVGVANSSNDTSVKVAVRIRPLSYEESLEDSSHSIRQVGDAPQVLIGCESTFTFDYVFGADSQQADVYDTCVVPLVEAAFEGFNATVLAYGQTGSGKTWTMGSSSDSRALEETQGIIPRVIRHLFAAIAEREAESQQVHAMEVQQEAPAGAPASSSSASSVTFKIYVQFLEIYGEDIKDLLDHTHTSKVSIRETASGDVYISGAKEELVHSPEQMMRALDEGSKFRATAATRMNESSSRSHAIFTVILEQSLYTEGGRGSLSGAVTSSGGINGVVGQRSDVSKPEVRKCKFHFVDLAGSERAKRTGAQGQQLREGIDINKGLLALGNVISALGDETKRGKVHVPYRDSKLTRMLQDSLGGNSKTLVICCASPSAASYAESVNALRYANRARNIQNKPIVNRDLTLVMLDELKNLVKVLATECLSARGRGHKLEVDNGLATEVIQALAAGSQSSIRAAMSSTSTSSSSSSSSSSSGAGTSAGVARPRSSYTSSTITSSSTTHRRGLDKPVRSSLDQIDTDSHSPHVRALKDSAKDHGQNDKSVVEVMRARSQEAEAETNRVSMLVKQLRQQLTDASDKALLLQSESDYYKMRWEEARGPVNATDTATTSTTTDGEAAAETEGETALLEGKGEFTAMAQGYLKQIDSLRRQLEQARAHSFAPLRPDGSSSDPFAGEAPELDTDFSLSVARVIAQTREQLERETRRLNSPDKSVVPASGATATATATATAAAAAGLMDIASGESDETRLAVVEEEAYQQRQKGLRSEVVELGESILVKEQLIEQLQRSQYQYDVMKTFYERKLHSLSLEMQTTLGEREKLATELQDLSQGDASSVSTHAAQLATQQRVDRERSLKEALRRKDDELKALKKRQDELSNLSSIQSKYASQAQRLQQEVESMKKQRVDLTKTLTAEKRRHVQLLSEKANEIERLRRQLARTAEEARKASREKDRAEGRTREALREQAMLRKRAMDMLKGGRDADANSANLSKARAARQALTSSRPQGRILSEEEMQTKAWLDRRLAEIASREAVAASLQRQCEHQLALLSRKEALEKTKKSLEQLSAQTRESGDSLALGLHSAQADDDEAQELQDQIASLESQLSARQDRIVDLQKLLESVDAGGSGGAVSTDKALEQLRRTATTLPQAHDLLRLLFDMLVGFSSAAKSSKSAQAAAEVKEARSKMEVELAQQTLLTRERQHSTEMAKVMRDNEERMQSLFAHSAVGAAVFAELEGEGLTDGLSNIAGDMSSNANFINSTPSRAAAMAQSSPKSRFGLMGRPWSWTSPSLKSPSSKSPSASRLSGFFGGSNGGGGSLAGASLEVGGIAVSSPVSERDPLRAQIAIIHEAHLSTRLQLETANARSASLSNQLEELSIQHSKVLKDSQEKEMHVRFLEDECRMFRDISERLRQSLKESSADAALPGRIIRQVKMGGAPGSTSPIPSSSAKNSASDPTVSNALTALGIESFLDSDDEDSASVIGQYDALADEINAFNLEDDLMDLAAAGDVGFTSKAGAGGSVLTSGASLHAPAPGVVFNRLTNPSNFTGAMKKVFEHDLVMKRQKVKEINQKSREGRAEPSSAFTTTLNSTGGSSTGSVVATSAGPAVTLGRTSSNGGIENLLVPGEEGHERNSPTEAILTQASAIANTNANVSSARQGNIFSRLSKQFTVASAPLSLDPERVERTDKADLRSLKDKDETREGVGNGGSAVAQRLLGVTDRLHQLSTLSHERKKIGTVRDSVNAPPPPPSFLKR